MRPRTQSFVAAAVLFSTAALACRPEDQRTETLDPLGSQTRAELPAEVIAQLDSGSAAYREDNFAGALAHYTEATRRGPDVAAGWFGVYMAQTRLGNAAAADSALERARDVAPGATLIHPTAADTAP